MLDGPQPGAVLSWRAWHAWHRQLYSGWFKLADSSETWHPFTHLTRNWLKVATMGWPRSAGRSQRAGKQRHVRLPRQLSTAARRKGKAQALPAGLREV